MRLLADEEEYIANFNEDEHADDDEDLSPSTNTSLASGSTAFGDEVCFFFLPRPKAREVHCCIIRSKQWLRCL